MSQPAGLEPYDGVLLVSFGGPESPEDVLPFLRRVTRGRDVPDERLALVAEHYLARGGVSPLGDENRDLITALSAQLAERGAAAPIWWGNRNAAPFLVDALAQAHAAGARRLVVVVTSAYSCYSSCRQYRENLAEALATLAEDGAVLTLDKIRPYAVVAPFAQTWAQRVRSSVEAAYGTSDPPAGTRLLCVTHSIPQAMDDTSGPGDGEGNLYVDQHLRVMRALADELGDWAQSTELVFCSRSGPPAQPWLEPDVNDRLGELAAEGVRDVVVAPIGFTADHMEVVQDLDTEAAATAAAHGIRMTRVPTPRTDATFVGALADLLLERAAQARGEAVTLVPDLPGDVRPAVCAAGCCPNLRVAAAAVCGED